MPHQVTVTAAKTGPDRSVAGTVITNVVQVDFQLEKKRIFVYTDPLSGTNVREFDLAPLTTVTFAIVAGNYSVTIG
jgi:citrate lyase synthetase